MRRLVLLLALAVVFGALVPASASNVLVSQPAVGGFMSSNISYVGTIPIDSPGVGGRVVKVGNQTRFYVTGVRGLSIYDVTNPALPLPLGHVEIPHWENEDVEVSADGKTVLLSVDGPGLIVIDASIPQAPIVKGAMAAGGHTTTCVVDTCDWAYSSEGHIFDLRDKAKPVNTGKKWFVGGARSSHDLFRDASGLVISDSNPRVVMDVSDPLNPIALAAGGRTNALDDKLQHNSIRPRAEQWQPRVTDADRADTNLRPGELLLGNSELNANTTCNKSGGFSTWSMRDFNEGAPLQQLEIFRPIRGTGDYRNGDPAVNALGCSGHWFTERDNMVAAAWYEHGVRVLSVDPTNGKIAQKGFFQPVVTSASAAHWVADAQGNEYIYSVDYARGIDILKFDRAAPVPSEAEFDASWLAKLGKTETLSARERFVCRLGAQ